MKSIVKDGYRFTSMPCGQVQFTKQIADTLIQYEVTIDCNKYDGKYQPLSEGNEEQVVLMDNQNNNKIHSEKQSKKLEDEITNNKFYPWKFDNIKDCYQNISWRVFNISLGSAIDSSFIRTYVHKKGGDIIESTENWDTKTGGNFMVSHNESSLYFFCTLINDNNQKEEKWEFRIIRTIPKLDQKLFIKEKEWQNKRTEYYQQ
ncbi:hypothetical protein JBL43_13680 [Aureibaculum sp. A20]|uniref:Uncharacterized protein n=1 Tax=Aureibaculum flavum TaxID=2795986 RepID=A0ABS0WTJ3_9FLAO|nr:hypothetical protein [Aureibaculum flavum]MBJ2175299.1 hypothetical protein [Aureibaculum flavum]